MGIPQPLDVQSLTADTNTQRQLAELQGFIGEYESRFFPHFVAPARWPRPVPELAAFFLVNIHNRARLLLWGTIEAIRASNFLAAVLCARGHYECTGSVAFCLRLLGRLYEAKISSEEASTEMKRLLAGHRSLPWDVPGEYNVRPLQVMDGIDLVDKLVKRELPGKVAVFRENYDFLSEFCHPNMLGIQLGRPSDGMEHYYSARTPCLSDREIGLVITYSNLAHIYYLYLYERIWTLLRENEKHLPELLDQKPQADEMRMNREQSNG